MDFFNNYGTTYKRYLAHPFTMVVYGPSGSGKTQWIRRLIQNASLVSDPSPKRIIYIYSLWQPVFDEFKKLGVELVRNIPEGIMDQFDGSMPVWIILDDVMNEAFNNDEVAQLFTKGSHHLNISVIFLVQNLFMQSKQRDRAQSIYKNVHYGVYFNNPRDKTIMINFAKQFAPKKAGSLLKTFEWITKTPYNPMIVDFKQDTPEEVRVMSNVFGDPPSNSLLVHTI